MKYQLLNKVQMRDGLNVVTGSPDTAKYTPPTTDKLRFARGHEEELMGRPQTALLVSTRLAGLKATGKRHGRP